jgi:uncharacterized membrane protein YqjE
MDEAPPESPPTRPRGLTEPLLRYLEARGILLTIEAQEALQQVLRVLLFVGVAAAAAFMGWVLLTAALVHVLMAAAGWSWFRAVTVLGIAHVALAIAFVLAVRQRVGGLRFFKETLNEFKKDRVWLASQTHKH